MEVKTKEIFEKHESLIYGWFRTIFMGFGLVCLVISIKFGLENNVIGTTGFMSFDIGFISIGLAFHSIKMATESEIRMSEIASNIILRLHYCQ